MVLDVRVGDAGRAADEAAGLEMIGRSQAVLEQQPACADQRLVPAGSATEYSVTGRVQATWK